MATRVGWLGVSNGTMGYIGEVVHGRWPISASSDGLYVSTAYTPTKFDTYLGYWTINMPQMTLAPDEIPEKVTIDTYEPRGDSYFYDNDARFSSPSPTLYLSDGSGSNFGTEQVLVADSSFLGNTAAITRTIPESIRKNYAGKPLSISYWNRNSDVMLRGHVKITVNTLYFSASVSYSNGPGGKITGAESAGRGQTIDVTVTPDPGYKLASITASSGSLTKVNNNKYTFTMATPATDATISATFALVDYNIVTSVTPSGAGAVTTNVTKAHYNDEITASCSTSSGEYYQTGWTISSSLTTQAYTTNDHVKIFKMPPADVTVTAVHLQHQIEWKNASLKAVQDDEDITLTYSGTCTDNFSRPLKFYIYMDGKMMYATKENGAYIPDETQTTPLEVAAPSHEEQSIVIKINNNVENKEVRFSIVAHDDQGITSGGATVSLNVQYINRTVKYCYDYGADHGHLKEWFECVPYFAVGPSCNLLTEDTVTVPSYDPNSFIFTGRIDPEFPCILSTEAPCGGLEMEIQPVGDGWQNIEIRTIPTTNDEFRPYVLKVNKDNPNVSIMFMPTKVEGTYDGKDCTLWQNWKLWTSGWVEVEPYYYDAENGWTLCSFS